MWHPEMAVTAILLAAVDTGEEVIRAARRATSVMLATVSIVWAFAAAASTAMSVLLRNSMVLDNGDKFVHASAEVSIPWLFIEQSIKRLREP